MDYCALLTENFRRKPTSRRPRIEKAYFWLGTFELRFGFAYACDPCKLRILQLHSDLIDYETIEKEVVIAEECKKQNQ